jgi:hypothetical protein
MKAKIRHDLMEICESVPIKKIYPYVKEFYTHSKRRWEVFQPDYLANKEENLILLDYMGNIYLARSIDFDYIVG